MFKLITEKHKKQIKEIFNNFRKTSVKKNVNKIHLLIEQIRNDIPEKKKTSYGRYSIIKILGYEIYPYLTENQIPIFEYFDDIFRNKKNNQYVRTLSIQIISIYAEKNNKLKKVLRVFEEAATEDNWEMRESSAGFIRKLVKKHPNKLKKWYLKQVKSENPKLRRFASESIRPVAENKWFKNNPDFCFDIIKNLFKEKNKYPRTSVGNNLSDWAKINKEKVYKIIEQLVNNKDKNSYWIAYRACRNLVKNEPLRVMDLLNTDVYKYKKRIHYRKKYLK